MKPFSILLAISSLALVDALAQAPAASAPTISSSSPTPWAVQVSPRGKQITVTFDQPMVPGFTAWLGRSSLPPEVDLGSSTVSDDRRTFVLNVEMQPAKVYVLGLNERGIPGAGFQNDKGLSLAPHYLVFQTAGNPAPADAPPRALSTAPPANAQQLDPTRLTGVTITFDKPMLTTKHGLIMREDKKPVDLSKAKFEYSRDGKSFTIAYQFKPSAAYEFELNSTQNIGFASAQRVPLWPVRFSFTTGQPQQ